MDLRIGHLFRLSTVRGKPIVVGNRVITPVARVMTVAAGLSQVGLGGGMTWVRPIAVEVLEGGTSSRVSIPDVNRRLATAIAAAFILPRLWQDANPRGSE
jgi:hypothetical protein